MTEKRIFNIMSVELRSIRISGESKKRLKLTSFEKGIYTYEEKEDASFMCSAGGSDFFHGKQNRGQNLSVCCGGCSLHGRIEKGRVPQ